MLHQLKRQLERGSRRVKAEVGRPFLQSHDAEVSISLYQPLPEGYIRLVTIQVANDTTTTVRLDIYPLRLAPRYDAVSYCWGDDNTSTRINCNGFELQIRKSLLAFLKASFHRKSPLRPLWIDAICLNQEDNAEKAVQVPLMGDVYKNATRTIVWLGEPEEGTLRTLAFIKAVTQIAQKKKDITFMGDVRWSDEWEAVRRYLRRPWFLRLWVLQEVVMSKNVEILCNAEQLKVISWSELNRFESILMKGDAWHKLTDDDRTTIDNYAHGFVYLVETLRSVHRRSGHLSMACFRNFYHARHCHEPVDRIWGLLGMLSPKLVAKVHEAKIIDYTDAGRREYWRSYLAFMKVLYACNVVDFFDVITDDISRGKNSPLPSWCVDFNALSKYESFRPFRTFRAGFIGLEDSTAIKSTLDLAEDALSISGFHVDNVSRVTPVHKIPDVLVNDTATDSYENLTPDDAEQVQTYLRWFEECYALCCQTLGDSDATKLAMCYTMLAADKEGTVMDFAMATAKEKKMTLDLALVEAQSTLMRGVHNTLRGNRDGMFLDDGKFWERLTAACRNRIIFATEHGRIGLGPPDLHVGDKVCCFIGAETLFALRIAYAGLSAGIERRSRLVAPPAQVGETFRLIGDVYLHGFMYGEAFKAENRGPNRDFVLV